MQALILAGGLGTRLRSLAPDRPKPMVEVHGRPFLDYQVEQLRAQGFSEFVLCVGYRARQVQDHFEDGRRWGVSISYAVETKLLGTAGAIRNAREWIAGPFLVMNGDSFLEADYRELVARHQRWRAADPQTVGTILTVAVEDAAAYGTLDLDADGRILHFQEKASAASGPINGGVYVLEPEILRCIPGDRPVSIERETFPQVLREGGHLYSAPAGGFFVDIGTPEGYRRFERYAASPGPENRR